MRCLLCVWAPAGYAPDVDADEQQQQQLHQFNYNYKTWNVFSCKREAKALHPFGWSMEMLCDTMMTVILKLGRICNALSGRFFCGLFGMDVLAKVWWKSIFSKLINEFLTLQ